MEILPVQKTDRISDLSKLKSVQNNIQVSTKKISQVETQVQTIQMNKAEFNHIMKNRPLIKYRPARNSFIKKGDKKILAEGLGLNVDSVEKYVQGIIDNDFEVGSKIDLKNDIKEVAKNDIDLSKTYVYRHGTQKQVVSCLKDDLKNGKTILNRLYKLFDEQYVGVYSYYARPCHILKNNDAKDMYDAIYFQLNQANLNGDISETDKLKASEFAIKKIHQIQNNPDVRQAIRFVWDKD